MFVLPACEQLKQINVWRRIYSGSDGKIRRGREEDEAQALQQNGEGDIGVLPTEQTIKQFEMEVMELKKQNEEIRAQEKEQVS